MGRVPYAIAGLVILAAWALAAISLSFQMGTLALLVFIVAVACVTGLVSPSDGPNVVANHGGIGLLVGAAVAAPFLLAKAGFILVGVGAIAGGLIGICVGIFRYDATRP